MIKNANTLGKRRSKSGRSMHIQHERGDAKTCLVYVLKVKLVFYERKDSKALCVFAIMHWSGNENVAGFVKRRMTPKRRSR